MLYGPWGGSGGSDFQDGIYTGVRQIVLSRGAGIISIRVEYDINGQSIWGNHHGGTTNAFKTDRVSNLINHDKGWIKISESIYSFMFIFLNNNVTILLHADII